MTRNAKIKPHCNDADDAINDAHLLSDWRKPTQTETSTNQDSQTPKKSKLEHCSSPFSFKQTRQGSGRHWRQQVHPDTQGCAKGLPTSSKTETKTWSTAAGMLKTSAKTERLKFSPPEQLQSARKIKKAFHVADMNLKNYDMIIGGNLITSVQLEVKGSDLSIQWEDGAMEWHLSCGRLSVLPTCRTRKATDD